MDDFSFEKFWNSSLGFLSYRPRSEKEVREHLKVKSQKSKVKIGDAIIESVIKKLKEHKFIDDIQFADWFVRSRLSARPKAARVLKMELKQKGIAREIIENSVFGQDIEGAKKLLVKKFDRYKDFNRDQIYQKLGGFLARRGYDWDTIKKAIDEGIGKRV